MISTFRALCSPGRLDFNFQRHQASQRNVFDWGSLDSLAPIGVNEASAIATDVPRTARDALSHGLAYVRYMCLLFRFCMYTIIKASEYGCALLCQFHNKGLLLSQQAEGSYFDRVGELVAKTWLRP